MWLSTRAVQLKTLQPGYLAKNQPGYMLGYAQETHLLQVRKLKTNPSLQDRATLGKNKQGQCKKNPTTPASKQTQRDGTTLVMEQSNTGNQVKSAVDVKCTTGVCHQLKVWSPRPFRGKTEQNCCTSP